MGEKCEDGEERMRVGNEGRKEGRNDCPNVEWEDKNMNTLGKEKH